MLVIATVCRVALKGESSSVQGLQRTFCTATAIKSLKLQPSMRVKVSQNLKLLNHSRIGRSTTI